MPRHLCAEGHQRYHMPMQDLPINLFDANGCRELDRTAIGQFGMPGFDLMQTAGGCVFEDLRRLWPEAGRISILCGPGNNGGDGYVVAALCAKAGLQVELVALAEPRSEDAQSARRLAVEAGLSPIDFSAIIALDRPDVVVDAVLGTGISRAPEGAAAEAIRQMNQGDAPVVAVDIPSGLNADNGSTPGAVVSAALTSTFIGMKVGLLTGRGPDYCGEIRFHDLNVPAEALNQVPATATRINRRRIFAALPGRRPCAHKGDQGHLLLLGGNKGMPGALRIASETAARSGTGLVSAVTVPENASAINIGQPEIMVHGLTEAAGMADLLGRCDAVVVGPGLGGDEWSRLMLQRLIEAKLPMIADADALNLVAGQDVRRQDWILTPHPGEAGRLLGLSAAEVEMDRIAAVQAIANRYGGICVLKGCGTLISDGSRIFLNTTGNAGMASGGMGDCLSGLIGSFIAQGLELTDAAIAGVYLHGAAADHEAGKAGLVGMLATDLIPRIRDLLNQS